MGNPAEPGTAASSRSLPVEHFVFSDQLFRNAVVDLKYCGSDNFLGRAVPGYESEVLIMTRQAVTALQRIEDLLEKSALGLKIFDAYRPQRSVDAFIEWALDENDTATREEYYPHLSKQQLFSEGYLVPQSAHSRGSTVDLTLINLHDNSELDMGTPFDYFDPRSWPLSEAVSEAQKNNRMLLRNIMLENGFKPLETEWWHFTLKDEPWPDTGFDFPVSGQYRF